MKRRKPFLIGIAGVIIVLVIVGAALFARTPATPQSSGPEELPGEETPPNLLVIPEVPLGTLAIVLACFSALIISQMKRKAKLR